MTTSTLKPLNQQIMVITGASSGIGLTTAYSAAAKGVRLVLVSRSAETMGKVVDQIKANGGNAVHVSADVGDRKQIDQVVEVAIQQFGRIDTWINNAGVSIYGRIEDISEKDNRRLFDTNFWGVVNGSLAALPHLKKSGGALINIGSEVSDAIVPLQGMYSASKHAVKGFTDALRVELLAEKAAVSVTLIQPTAVNTPYPQHAKNYMDKEPKLPSPQIDPQQVADAILDAAIHVTRDVAVGIMAKINTTVAKIAPSIGDWIAGKQIDRQQMEESPRNPDGTLFHAGETGKTHGERTNAH